jgi:hypothetical protein
VRLVRLVSYPTHKRSEVREQCSPGNHSCVRRWSERFGRASTTPARQAQIALLGRIRTGRVGIARALGAIQRRSSIRTPSRSSAPVSTLNRVRHMDRDRSVQFTIGLPAASSSGGPEFPPRGHGDGAAFSVPKLHTIVSA